MTELGSCSWCSELAVDLVLIEASVWKRAGDGARCVAPEKRAPACEDHAARMASLPPLCSDCERAWIHGDIKLPPRRDWRADLTARLSTFDLTTHSLDRKASS